MTVYFTKEHEWVRVEGDTGTVGVSNHAQEQLGDVVFVEPPEVGRTVKQGEQAAVVESVKAASEIYAPLSGEVTAANEALVATPALLNQDAEGEAWIFKLRLSDPGEVKSLMDQGAYASFLKTLG